MDRTRTKSISTFARRGADYFGVPSREEFILAASMFALLIVLSIVGVLHRKFDSDEPQHLHIIWAWTQGLLQYRDVFDNHMPLFHILFAPVFGLIGERATILYWMRFILLPMSFVGLWCTYQIGTSLFSRRAGIWAAVGVGFFGAYQSAVVQFRPDSLWMSIWLLCIAALVRGEINPERALAAGLLLGLCFGISMKSSLFLFSLLLSAPLALALTSSEKSKSDLVKSGAVFIAATGTVPVIIMIFFAANGLWRDFRYGVFDFNFVTSRVYQKFLLYENHPVLAAILFVSALLVTALVVRRIAQVSPSSEVAFARGLTILVCVTYLLALYIFWPPISRTYLPFYPLGFVICSGGLLAFSERLARREVTGLRILRLLPLPAFLALAELFLLAGTQPLLKDKTRSETILLCNVLALTEPNDYIFDAKGETIFRRRCYRPVLERISRKAIRRGIIMDASAEQFADTRTCVVATIMVERFSKATRDFVWRNYLPVAQDLRVAGAILRPSAVDVRRDNFEIVIPASYKIVSVDGNVSGILDGTTYAGARFLAAGPHTFEPTSMSGEFVCLWAQAADRHFTPFEIHTRRDK